MKLESIQNTFRRRKIITYASDHCTAVVKNICLQQLAGYLYKGKNKSDQYGQTFCRFYIFYPELDIGMDVGGITYPDTRTVEEIQSWIDPALLQGPRAFIKALDQEVIEGKRIVNAQIELARYIAPEKVDVYIEARQQYLDKREAARKLDREKREAEDAAYCKEKNEETHKEINRALEILRTGGKLENDCVVFYKTRYDKRSYQIVNYLAREYGVEIPLKVQGWINHSLVHVIIRDGKTAQIRYTGRMSKTVWLYMDQLIHSVCEHESVQKSA